MKKDNLRILVKIPRPADDNLAALCLSKVIKRLRTTATPDSHLYQLFNRVANNIIIDKKDSLDIGNTSTINKLSPLAPG